MCISGFVPNFIVFLEQSMFIAEFGWMNGFCSTAQAHYERSVRIYQSAFETCKHCHGNKVNMASIVKRLANALNELGVCYMHLASQEIDQSKLCAVITSRREYYDIFGMNPFFIMLVGY